MFSHATIPVPVVPDNFASPPVLADSPPAVAEPSLTLLDRDHSILAFNERVLDWAYRPEVPLIERLRYLCIVSSNLDEFFEVRTAPHLAASTRRRPQGQLHGRLLRRAWPRRRIRWWAGSTRSTTTS